MVLVQKITLMARKINERQPSEIANFIYNFTKKIKNFSKKPKIALIGLAFKGSPITDDLRGSMAITVFKELKNKFKQSKFFGYDPVVSVLNIKKLGLRETYSLSNAYKNKSLIIILNNHSVLSNMPIEKFSKQLKKPAMIYDFCNHFDSNKLKLPKNVEYISLGSHCKNTYFNKK